MQRHSIDGELLELAPTLLWVVDDVGGLVYANQRWLAFAGRSLDDERGDGWLSRVHEDDRRAAISALRAACLHRQRFEREVRLQRYDGEFRWMLLRAEPVSRQQPGEPSARMVGTATDITLRHASEVAQRQRTYISQQQRSELEAIYAATPVGLAVIDETGRLRRVNHHLASLYGRPARDFLGRLWTDALGPIAASIEPAVARVFETAEPIWQHRATGPLSSVDVGRSSWLINIMPLTSVSESDAEPPTEPHVRAVNVVVQDVSPLQDELEARQESERRLQTLLNSIPDFFYVKDRNGRYLLANRPTLALFGREGQDARGLSDYDLLPAADAEKLHANDTVVFQTGEVHQFEESFEVDGKQRTFLSTKFPLRDNRGKIYGVCGLSKDITRQVEAEAALRESEQRFVVALANSPVVVFEMDTQLRYTWVFNPHASETVDSMLGKTDADLLEPADAQKLMRFKERVLTTGNPELGQFTLRIDGRATVWHLHAEPLYDDDGRVRGLSCRAIDMSEQYEQARQIRESEASFGVLADVVPHLVWAADVDGKLAYVNRRLQDYVGRPADALLGEDWLTLVAAEHRRDVRTVWRQCRDREQAGATEHAVYDAQGKPQWHVARLVPLFDDENRLTRWFGTWTNIHDRKQSEETLQALNTTLETRVRERTAELEHLNQRLRWLVTELTQTEQRERRRLAETLHDHLQQLLVAAKMRLDLLARSADEQAATGLNQASKLIRESIDMSRTLTAELRPPILYEDGLVAALFWLSNWMEEQHHLRVELNLHERAEPDSESVRVLLFTCVRELLLNTVKHAAVKHARVTLEQRDDWLHVWVGDDGTGFDPEQLEKTAGRGSGFGLFSIRERLRGIGGAFQLQSAPGEGVHVMLAIPHNLRITALESGEAAVYPPPPNQEPDAVWTDTIAPGIRVLLAEDHELVREGLASLLDNAGDIHVVAKAADGEEAIALARQHQPDVIVMDVNMPRCNGIEATRRIRNEQPDIAIIGLSVQDEVGIADAMKRAGARAFLAKAGPGEQLIDTIRQLSGNDTSNSNTGDA